MWEVMRISMTGLWICDGGAGAVDLVVAAAVWGGGEDDIDGEEAGDEDPGFLVGGVAFSCCARSLSRSSLALCTYSANSSREGTPDRESKKSKWAPYSSMKTAQAPTSTLKKNGGIMPPEAQDRFRVPEPPARAVETLGLSVSSRASQILQNLPRHRQSTS